jgi:hypothetical protein
MEKRITRFLWLGSVATLVVAAVPPMRGADTNTWPEFREVYDLLRTKLVGVSEKELNQKAVEGLLQQFKSRAVMEGQGTAPGVHVAAGDLAATNIFEDVYGYVRVGAVESGLKERMFQTLDVLRKTNGIKGLVIDLRFADGMNYAEAGAVADLFVNGDKPLLEFGNTKVRSTEKKDDIGLPLMILVNGQTAGAAEALAGAVRQATSSMLIGASTAGRAYVYQEYALSQGSKLLLADAPVVLGDGTAIPATGLKPDLTVAVRPEDERAYLADPFKVSVKTPAVLLSVSGTNANGKGGVTNRVARHRINEADLVRMQKEGGDGDTDEFVATTGPLPASRPVVQDPVLARALDLLKGLEVLRKTK